MCTCTVDEDGDEEEVPTTDAPAEVVEQALGQFKSKKSKVKSKTGAATQVGLFREGFQTDASSVWICFPLCLQWEILKMSGVPEEEIPKFAVRTVIACHKILCFHCQ